MPQSDAKIVTSKDQKEDRPLLGMLLRLAGIAVLATMFMLIKLVGDRGVHVVEVLFYRYTLGALFIGGWMISSGQSGHFKTERLTGHAARAAIGLVAMSCNFAAVMLLPLPEAAVLRFTMPLIATVLSVIVLREFVGWRRSGAVIVGFVGILIAIQPGQGELPLLGVLAGLAGALAGSGAMILIRKLSSSESTETIVFYYMFLAAPVTAVGVIFVGSWHSMEVYALLLAIGVLGTIGMYLISGALRFASISVALPMDYASIIFSTFYAYLIWGHWPDASLWAAIPFIIGSGLYIAMRERKRREQTDAS